MCQNIYRKEYNGGILEKGRWLVDDWIHKEESAVGKTGGFVAKCNSERM